MRKFLTQYRAPLRFTLALLPVAAAAGYLVIRYQLALYDPATLAAMLAQLGSTAVLLAVGTALLAYGGKGEGSLTATVKHRGQVVAQVELSSLPGEKTIAIDGTYHLTVILDKTGAAVTDSDCPGQDCVHTGRITRAGQSIVCLPEQVVVTLEGKTPSADVILG